MPWMGCLIPHRIHVFDLDSGYGYLRSRVTLSSHPFTVFDTSHQLQIAACRGVTIVSPNVAEENTLVPFVVVIRLAVSQLVLLCVNLEGPGGLCVGVHCHGWELMRLIIDFLESTPLIRLLLLLVVGCCCCCWKLPPLDTACRALRWSPLWLSIHGLVLSIKSRFLLKSSVCRSIPTVLLPNNDQF